MVQLKKETVIKTFRDKDILIETLKQFHYNTKQEKMNHMKLMEEEGYKDSGQVEENIGTVTKPEYVWYGGYVKIEIKDREVSADDSKKSL